MSRSLIAPHAKNSRTWLASKTWPHLFQLMPQEHSPDPKETISRFEKLLAGLVRGGVDFAVGGGLAVILNGCPRLIYLAHSLPFPSDHPSARKVRRLAVNS
jgi:hypothetical protein